MAAKALRSPLVALRRGPAARCRSGAPRAIPRKSLTGRSTSATARCSGPTSSISGRTIRSGRFLGLPATQRVSFESGQVLVDKRRHGQALAATFLLNEQAETIYDLVYGDKDTFLLGWLLTGATHAVVPHRPFADDRTLTQRDFGGAGVSAAPHQLQMDLQRRTAFLSRRRARGSLPRGPRKSSRAMERSHLRGTGTQRASTRCRERACRTRTHGVRGRCRRCVFA
ncbi:MAG: hypothetical protein WDN31_04300 [Hyphomicrobium sp.]